MKSYIYKRENDDLTEIERLINQPYEIYIASDRDNNAFQRLKQDMMHEPGLLIISSLCVMGADKRAILEELEWLQENGISTIVYDLAATWVFNDPIASDLVLRVLIDIYSSLQNNKSFEAPVKTGRIVFPENWGELYSKWSSGEITAKEFIERSGLKKRHPLPPGNGVPITQRTN